jgi:hypothetical protein
VSKILRVPVDRKLDLRGLGGSTVYSGQFQLGVTTAHEDGMAVYESIDGKNFYRLVELSASGMQSTLPDTPYIYVTEKDVKKYDGGTVVGTGANITIEGVEGRIKGFADSSPLGAEDRIKVTGTLTGAGVGIVSGTTYEIKEVHTDNGNNASAQIELVELDGTPVTTSGSALTGLTFTLLNESSIGATATITELEGSSKYFGASTLHYYKEI